MAGYEGSQYNTCYFKNVNMNDSQYFFFLMIRRPPRSTLFPTRRSSDLIFNRRIASKGGGWRAYHGSNPHTSHVHVSVGVGPDGRSTGPYDDTSPWGLASTSGGIMALPRRGDEGDEVEVIQRMLVAAGDRK